MDLQFGKYNIIYELSYRERKSLGIKVFPDCSVKVVAPLHTSPEKIRLKVLTKAPWIIKQQNEFLSFHPLTPKRKFINGETHLYLGRQYKLRIEAAEFNEVNLFRGRLIIYCMTKSNPEKIMRQWYQEKANLHFRELLEETFPRFEKYRVPFPQLIIRVMQKRWGSCTPNGKIILNPELIKAPKGSIEYVIIHELCHLVHHNHTKAFYNLQGKMMPDWEKWKERLEYSLV